jgi:hypothetical protein
MTAGIARLSRSWKFVGGDHGGAGDRDPETDSARLCTAARPPKPVSVAAEGRDHQRLVNSSR